MQTVDYSCLHGYLVVTSRLVEVVGGVGYSRCVWGVVNPMRLVWVVWFDDVVVVM